MNQRMPGVSLMAACLLMLAAEVTARGQFVEEAAGPREVALDQAQGSFQAEPIPVLQVESAADLGAAPEPKGEIIRERYPSRAVKIEREVIQDQAGNYVNHGTFRMWDPNGTLVLEGQYYFGKREAPGDASTG